MIPNPLKSEAQRHHPGHLGLSGGPPADGNFPAQAATGGRTRMGFSLIELLSVIAIIAILVAILIPATSAIRGKVKNVCCASNLRNIGTASLLYSQENNGLLVMGSTGTADASLPYNLVWFHLLRPYFEHGEQSRAYAGTAFMPWIVCPGDPAEGGRSISKTHIERRSYAVNRDILTYRQTKGVWPRTQDVEKPADSIYFTDHDHEGTGSKTWVDAALVVSSPELKFWHQGDVNCLMVDGSVQMIPIAELRTNGERADFWKLEKPITTAAR